MQKNMSSFCFVCFLKLNMLCGKSCLVLPNVRGIHYLFGKARCCNDRRNFVFLLTERHNIIYILQYSQFLFFTSQRSLHNAPIFCLLLKVAVNGTHQCDFSNFCGTFGFQQTQCRFGWPAPTGTAHAHCALARRTTNTCVACPCAAHMHLH